MAPRLIRDATARDLPAIRRIYNEAIDDRIATLETNRKSAAGMRAWFAERDKRYAALVALDERIITGWASLNRFSQRCAHAAIAYLSIYVSRDRRGTGIGGTLLRALISRAKEGGFHKIVLHALRHNEAGRRLYRSCGFRYVGTFREHGMLDGRYVDVIAMERLL